MTREEAKNRFLALYAIGFVVGLLLRVLDAPRAVGWGVVIVWGIGMTWLGLLWLHHALRDGSLREAVPSYGLAFLSLVLIACGCALATLLALLVIGEPVTGEWLTSGAAIGTLVVAFAWAALRSVRNRRRAT